MHKVCDKKMVTARLVCATRKDEEEEEVEEKKKKSVEEARTHTHTYIYTERVGEKKNKEASVRMRNEQVKRGMLKPCACMQRGNSRILYVQSLWFGMRGVVRYAYMYCRRLFFLS